LTYSGRFTHISGHPSATGRAQDRESSPAKDRRSTTEPRNQPYESAVQMASRLFQQQVSSHQFWTNLHAYIISPRSNVLTKHKRFKRPLKLSDGDVRCPKLLRQTSTVLARQWLLNWLRDLLTMHVRLSADCSGRRSAAVTSGH